MVFPPPSIFSQSLLVLLVSTIWSPLSAWAGGGSPDAPDTSVQATPSEQAETEGAHSARAEAATIEASEAGTVPVASAPVVLGTSYRFASRVMNEERVLNVLLPPGYDESEEARFPVIYLLDGAVDEDFHHVAGLVQFLTMYRLMPRSILVGIANTDRYRDFTHETKVAEELERVPNAGGSTRFVRYLAEEVQPFVDSSFRTDGGRTLIGQSLGGLLASEIFLERPGLFDTYVIVSPSFWWNEGSLITRLEEALTLGKASKESPEKRSEKAPEDERAGRLVLSIGTEGLEMQSGVDRFVAALEKRDAQMSDGTGKSGEKGTSALEWHYLPLPEETHATILHRAIYRAFELLYGETHPGL